jgi:hypothetical protein
MPDKNTNGPRARAGCKNDAYKAGQANPSNCAGESQRLNPINASAERSVLGALIEDDTLVPEVIAAGLRTEHFALSDHRRVFGAILALRLRKAPVDYVLVAEQMGNRHEDYILLAGLIQGGYYPSRSHLAPWFHRDSQMAAKNAIAHRRVDHASRG